MLFFQATIGREGSVTFKLDSQSISKRHAILQKRTDEWYIKDNNFSEFLKRNPTFATFLHGTVLQHVSYIPQAGKSCIEYVPVPESRPEDFDIIFSFHP